ncbi:hypothetical protein [Mycobacterium colombiense]|uniref:hypothetical protein n=1 Tax=Mycobacterium colombiense TaxID=339268 RepID=UPI00148254E4|nr:hypothetical protein [Mycobacterium colombiense]
MTESRKAGIWLVLFVVVFLMLAWFGKLALIAGLALLVFRFAVIGGMVMLIALALRKAG